MENRHKQWMCDEMQDTTRAVLETIHKIIKDSDDKLTSTELEDLNYCWDIIRDMYKIKLTIKEIEAHEKQDEKHSASTSNNKAA